MMHTKNICLLGFSKQAELLIKNQLEQKCHEFDLIWVSANAKALDGIIINALFLDTPQIEKYVATVNAPCVSIYTQPSGRDIAQKHHMLTLPLEDKLNFSNDWLNKLLSLNQTALDTAHSDTASLSKEYSTLIESIKNRDAVYIQTSCDEKIAYLSPAEQSAYINFARSDIPGIENWRWKKIEQIPHPEAMRRINIDQWLFETLWQSQTETFSIDPAMFYKLIRWPQPFSQHRRSEALRLAAQIKFHPVKIEDLVEKTRFAPELIEQFLYATNQAGQIEVIEPTEETVLENKRIDTLKSDPDRETKKSFIGRLRSKLGL
ncbi:hypothetical protein KRX19_06855 [Cardiobacteriaceae bacterium TAE3-ERU3]|nr:hypothetical protein [Cardiobacteriaceae bacterium TAE3-ERU3]